MSDGKTDDEVKRGSLGDARPDGDQEAAATEGGQPQEEVEDRPNVGTVRPEDYPSEQRAKGSR